MTAIVKIKIAGNIYDADSLTLPEDREHREFWLAPVNGVVQVDWAAALTKHKAKILADLNADAERIRLKYITPGEGQAMTYQEKFEQASAVDAMGQAAADALTPAEYIDQFPTLAASVGLEAASLWDCAQLVIAKKEAWADLSFAIELKRLNGIAAINAAATVADVNSAYASVDWTGL